MIVLFFFVATRFMRSFSFSIQWQVFRKKSCDAGYWNILNLVLLFRVSQLNMRISLLYRLCMKPDHILVVSHLKQLVIKTIKSKMWSKIYWIKVLNFVFFCPYYGYKEGNTHFKILIRSTGCVLKRGYRWQIISNIILFYVV